MTLKPSARRSADPICAPCRGDPPNVAVRPFIGPHRLVADRVRLVNQVRGLLGEHGIVVAKDIGNLRRALAGLGDNEIALFPWFAL